MKIDFTTGGRDEGNGAGALALAVAIIHALVASGKLSDDEARAIVVEAKSLLPPPHQSPGASARRALSGIHL